MSDLTATSGSVGAGAHTIEPARDLGRAGLGAVIAAGCLLVWGPVWILVLAPLLGVPEAAGAARFDPVSSASWTAGIAGLLELSWVAGVAALCVGVRRVAAHGWMRDIAALGALLWIAGLALHAASFMVVDTPAQTASWTSITDDVTIRAAIGASAVVVQWGFFAVAVIGAFVWTAAHVAGNRAAGLVGLGTGIPAVGLAAVATVLCVLGIVPPAATFAQIVLLLLIGVPLLVRSRRMRRSTHLVQQPSARP